MAVAVKAGYVISVEDLRAAVKSVAERRMEFGELSEADLEKVAGGPVGESERQLAFVRELLLAAEAGYLTYGDMQGG